MDNIKSLMFVVFLTGALGFSVASAGAENVISKDVLTDGSFCHAKVAIDKYKTNNSRSSAEL
jgi:hypothetical protein